MDKYERIPYTSFLWKLGTTSFRTQRFNKMTEWQLRLLDEFWTQPENKDLGWETAVDGQNDIYEVKNRYYDWLVFNGFTKGNDRVKYKAAREKTSGLYDMGLINNEHRLTEVGRELLRITEERSYLTRTPLGISADSMLYLKQLLKLSDRNTGTVVRPLIVVLYLLSKLGNLSNDEFRYLVPLCTDESSTQYILHHIRELRDGRGSIDQILTDVLLSKGNYQEGRKRFMENEFSESLLLSVGMNRKSEKYDKPYAILYQELHAVYMEQQNENIVSLFESMANFQPAIAIKWKTMLFDTTSKAAVKHSPETHLRALPEGTLASETAFKDFFYTTMHLNKAKTTLEDYLDLNRRYLGLTNCFIFANQQVTLDTVPKQFFGAAIDDLYRQAYQASDLLFVNSSLEDICPSLTFNEQTVIEGLSRELGTTISTIDEAYTEVDKIRYNRLNKLINEKFDNKVLLRLLDDFEKRNDDHINQLVTDNADIPTIFEYIIGIIWYKTSERQGNLLDYMKLSLDANLLPVTHAGGGEADIVYEYNHTNDYPAHNVLLEATLAESTNQRRMEMEPVSRHVGNHLLKTGNMSSYGIFITTYLHINVISDFKSRKHVPYFNPQDEEHFIEGMKITPLNTQDLKTILTHGLTYQQLYEKFDKAYQLSDNYVNPKQWYKEQVSLITENEAQTEQQLKLSF